MKFFYEFVSGEKLSDCQNLTDLEPFFSYHRNSDLYGAFTTKGQKPLFRNIERTEETFLK